MINIIDANPHVVVIDLLNCTRSILNTENDLKFLDSLCVGW